MKDQKILYLVSDRHDVLAGMVLYMNLLPLNLWSGGKQVLYFSKVIFPP